MILRDIDIQQLVTNAQLITNFDAKQLSNCRYNLRAARAYSPATGDEQLLVAATVTRPVAWQIKPSETLIVMTREEVRIPADVMATYGQLNRLAQRGVSLINTSIVEPGYSGPLSCFLVNFSSQTVFVYPDDPVAKMCFMKLTGAPNQLVSQSVSSREYERILTESAQRYPVSFLDIGGIEQRIEDRVSKGVNQSIKLGGAIVLVLTLWAGFEPVVSKWLWEKVGVVTVTQHEQLVQMREELKNAKTELESARKALEAERRMLELQQKSAPSAPPSTGKP
jgi:deoxycytidine triphosphate deaminase